MERSQDMLRPHQNWYSAVLSFGLVRWWPIWMRARVARSLGPFKMVIECKATGVHF